MYKSVLRVENIQHSSFNIEVIHHLTLNIEVIHHSTLNISSYIFTHSTASFTS